MSHSYKEGRTISSEEDEITPMNGGER